METTTPHQTYYAIGDIHGNYDKLDTLLNIIGEDKSAIFVFLGDYIDRGPQSKDVVERLIKFSKNHTCIFLKGNHEALLELIHLKGEPMDQEALMLWIMNGGDETCKSYNGCKNIYKLHSTFFQTLKLYYETPNFIFVHAGLKRGIPLKEQTEEDLLWIRDQFIINPTDYPDKIVIYGHTITDMCVSPYPDKIGVDTGAGWGGQLSALKLPEKQFIKI